MYLIAKENVIFLFSLLLVILQTCAKGAHIKRWKSIDDDRFWQDESNRIKRDSFSDVFSGGGGMTYHPSQYASLNMMAYDPNKFQVSQYDPNKDMLNSYNPKKLQDASFNPDFKTYHSNFDPNKFSVQTDSKFGMFDNSVAVPSSSGQNWSGNWPETAKSTNENNGQHLSSEFGNTAMMSAPLKVNFDKSDWAGKVEQDWNGEWSDKGAATDFSSKAKDSWNSALNMKKWPGTQDSPTSPPTKTDGISSKQTDEILLSLLKLLEKTRD